MNKLNKLYARMGAFLTVAAASVTTAMASETPTTTTTTSIDADLSQVVDPVVALIKSLLNPAMAVVTAVGLIYCIILGVKYAQSEEPQQREKAKNHLKNAIIGFLMIFILMIALVLLTPALKSWVNDIALNNHHEIVFPETPKT